MEQQLQECAEAAARDLGLMLDKTIKCGPFGFAIMLPLELCSLGTSAVTFSVLRCGCAWRSCFPRAQLACCTLAPAHQSPAGTFCCLIYYAASRAAGADAAPHCTAGWTGTRPATSGCAASVAAASFYTNHCCPALHRRMDWHKASNQRLRCLRITTKEERAVRKDLAVSCRMVAIRAALLYFLTGLMTVCKGCAKEERAVRKDLAVRARWLHTRAALLHFCSCLLGVDVGGQRKNGQFARTWR